MKRRGKNGRPRRLGDRTKAMRRELFRQRAIEKRLGQMEFNFAKEVRQLWKTRLGLVVGSYWDPPISSRIGTARLAFESIDAQNGGGCVTVAKSSNEIFGGYPSERRRESRGWKFRFCQTANTEKRGSLARWRTREPRNQTLWKELRVRWLKQWT